MKTKELELSAPPTPQGSSHTTWDVKFTAPAQPPDTNRKEYTPTLLVGKSKQRVVSQSGEKVTYGP